MFTLACPRAAGTVHHRDARSNAELETPNIHANSRHDGGPLVNGEEVVERTKIHDALTDERWLRDG
ncbi:hypothetical protein P3T76_016016 [Phytophthora citrophthora]|uniref:Uncharacterized protein n=1 Tax=Phytophthora citrophthora TaxID=4793 RepID=A0AAD9L9R2_9STRA|nr:hypothetical protein P3T76_016016 [Phytophthora citrophthora]